MIIYKPTARELDWQRRYQIWLIPKQIKRLERWGGNENLIQTLKEKRELLIENK